MQLDLFTDMKPAEVKSDGTVRAFPPARRAALVRSTAATIYAKSYQAGRAFWSKHVAQLKRELKAIGIDASGMAVEIDRYTIAVGREIDRLTYSRRRPDGAA
ncbi:DUF6074 family protein [Mesorhizobium loti]|uniref:Uncharacterized protein n=1 Tax=Rhizobium loti TaxID=381 RepID=A0A6M7U449_RHILI|nr:DUF6074 family protein [Mesorhizobium loti]OBQ72252.1 hypothetical protein A8145_05375 [Mesorhizobium loti]QKC72151.1 hypothetical protein EB815_25605 [Mesorhizobium loti]